MLNTKYFKDLNHNYLIIKENLKEDGKNYQHKMITTNRMKHLLECKIRYVDEECHFYYEISSKQSISGLYGNKLMGYEQLRHLFEHMQEALCELENYMLDSRRLILQPEYIFVEPQTEEFYFLYYPHYVEEDSTMTQMSFSQFLVDKVDHEQQNAIDVVYKVYEMMQDGQFLLSSILDMFTESEPAAEWAEPEIENTNTWSEEVGISKTGEWCKEDNGAEDNLSEIEGNSGHLLVAGILLPVCAVAAVAVFCIRYFFALSAQENIFAIAGIGVLTLVSAFLMLYLIFNLYAQKKKKPKKEESVPTFVEVVPDFAIEPEVDGKKYLSPNRKINKNSHTVAMEDNEYGNTVFLEDAINRSENKLYGTNRGNKYHIDLNRLPCTIGKMAGSVDVVIKDSTISRIHARFTRQDEGIYVTDMNSTNGSFKNGLRLEPNETVLIEPGDELRFGRMTFCYR